MTAYFQDELNLLQEWGKEHALRNPRLEKYFGASATDPDVEHLLEAFAFLTSSLREKIDDELPEITHALIEQIWPNFLRPFPPVAMLKFTPQEKSITEHQSVSRGTIVMSPQQNGSSCTFRTTADCAIYPLEVAGLKLDRTRDKSIIELDFATLSGLPLSAIKLDTLRLTLCGDLQTRQALYLWLCRHLAKIIIKPKGAARGFTIPAHRIKPGALGRNESLLPESNDAFDGYRLLQEFFCFPDKFHCIDLSGLAAMVSTMHGTEFSLVFEFARPLPFDVKPDVDNIQLYCVPIINLFPATSEPVSFKNSDDDARDRKILTPLDHQAASIEIFSVDSVTTANAPSKDKRGSSRTYAKFEANEHRVERASNRQEHYWRHLRRSLLGTQRLEHEIVFVSHDGKRAAPQAAGITANLTCFNGDAATRLGPGMITARTADAPSFAKVSNMTTPTAPVYPPFGGALGWQLISNLSLNNASLNTPAAFNAIVMTYDTVAFNDRQAERAAVKRAQGMVSLVTRPTDRLFRGMPIRGIKSVMHVKESAFASEGELQLYATVLSEFMAHYSTTNSFHQLEIRGVEKGEVVTFPARPGRQPLI